MSAQIEFLELCMKNAPEPCRSWLALAQHAYNLGYSHGAELTPKDKADLAYEDQKRMTAANLRLREIGITK